MRNETVKNRRWLTDSVVGTDGGDDMCDEKKPIGRWGLPIRKRKTAASRRNCAVDEPSALIGHSCAARCKQ